MFIVTEYAALSEEVKHNEKVTLTPEYVTRPKLPWWYDHSDFICERSPTSLNPETREVSNECQELRGIVFILMGRSLIQQVCFFGVKLCVYPFIRCFINSAS